MDQKNSLTENNDLLKTVIDNMVNVLKQEREKEIITRRFGLGDSKETLEQIGGYLGVTRERVRQLEKAILIHLKIKADENEIAKINELERLLIQNLIDLGFVASIKDLSKIFFTDNDQTHNALALVAEISDKLILIEENDRYKLAIAIAKEGDQKKFKQRINDVVKSIKNNRKPISAQDLNQILEYDHPRQVEALASISKKLSTLNNVWGLSRWASVNPKNIKDKVFLVLQQNTKPMHYSEIATAIKNSDFKRKDVTKQAIHNELIKDKRFVLIGRGIYALKEWGYSRGTVYEIIAQVLEDNKKPMYRDDIVRQVLKRRKVKETTVLLNLQARPEFKRVAKATYIYEPLTEK